MMQEMWTRSGLMHERGHDRRRAWRPAASATRRRSRPPCPPTGCWCGRPKDGWEPLCAFLEAARPGRAVPARERQRGVRRDAHRRRAGSDPALPRGRRARSARRWSRIASAAASGQRVALSRRTSGASGGSYGASTPVKPVSSPRARLAVEALRVARLGDRRAARRRTPRRTRPARTARGRRRARPGRAR